MLIFKLCRLCRSVLHLLFWTYFIWYLLIPINTVSAQGLQNSLAYKGDRGYEAKRVKYRAYGRKYTSSGKWSVLEANAELESVRFDAPLHSENSVDSRRESIVSAARSCVGMSLRTSLEFDENL